MAGLRAGHPAGKRPRADDPSPPADAGGLAGRVILGSSPRTGARPW